jgi:hypothetical protein
MLVRHTDGRDELELHQAAADGSAVHVKAKPKAMADLWKRFGSVEVLTDGTKSLVIDGGA